LEKTTFVRATVFDHLVEAVERDRIIHLVHKISAGGSLGILQVIRVVVFGSRQQGLLLFYITVCSILLR